MLRCKKKTLTGLTLLSILSFSVSAMDEHNELEDYLLIENLEKYSKTREIPLSRVLERVGRLVLEDKKIAKGGVGTLGSSNYVHTEQRMNSAVIKGENWVGKSYEVNQVLYVDGDSFSESIEGMDPENLLIIIFTPSEIRFVDYGDSSGGKYIRRIRSE